MKFGKSKEVFTDVSDNAKVPELKLPPITASALTLMLYLSQ